MSPSDLEMKPRGLDFPTLLLSAFAAASSADLHRRQFAAISDCGSRISAVDVEFLSVLMVHIKSQCDVMEKHYFFFLYTLKTNLKTRK